MLKLLKLLFLTVLLKSIHSNYIAIDISVNLTEINTPASYTFTLKRDFNPLVGDFVTPSNVPVGSIIQFIFPSDYVNMAQGSTVPCTDSATGLSLICQYSGSSNIITVKNYYSTSSTTGNIYPSIKIDSILNPPKSSQTGNFLYYIRDSSGIIIDQSPSANNGIYSTALSFTSGTFLSYKISAEGATILTRSRLVVRLTPKNQIGSTNKIILDFPLTWANNLQGNITIITNPICSAITNVASTITCSYETKPLPINRAYVTVTGLTSTSISSEFSFAIQTVLTPPTVESSESIVISSQQSDGSKIDTCTTFIVNLSPIQFQTSSFQSTSNTVVQSSFNGRISLSIAKPFAYYDTVVFTLPSIFLNAVVSSTSFSSFSQTRDTSSSSITLSNFPSTSSRSTGSQINFVLQSITNPVSIKPVNIIVSFYRLGSLYQQSTLSYSAIAGTVQSFKILPNLNFVYEKGQAEMQLISTLAIPSGSKIIVSYPANVIVSDSSSAAVNSVFLNGVSVSSGTFRVSSNTIYFENIFQSNFTSGTILVNFPQFSNPFSIQPTNYLLKVQTSDGSTIFTGSLTFTATLKSLISNDLKASSYKVLDTSVLTMTIELNYAATAISIILPADISLKTGFQTTCLPNTLNSCYLNGLNLTFEGNFQPGTQTLAWGNVQNPNSFQSTQSFSIFTYNRGWGVEKSLGNIYLQMNETNSFPSVLIVPSSLKNNEQITVRFTINFPQSSPVPGTLTIVFPSQLDISSSSCDISCTKIGNNISFSISSWSSNLVTTISRVINAPSFKPNGDFIFELINANNFASLFQSKSSWTNNIASTFTTTVSSSDAYRGQNALFKFNITSISGKQSYVVLKFSDLFGGLTTAPNGAILVGSRTVRYDIVNQASTDFSMTLLTPVIFGDYTFSAQTYIQTNGVSYLISQSLSNVWRHTCFNTVCKRCNPNDNSKCIDCYNTTISDYYIYDTALQTCTRDCLSGFFMSGNVCSPCSGSCLECANISTNCTSCSAAQSLFLDTVYMKCVSTCADGYYKNTQIQTCLPCSPPCLYCQDSATKCTYCPAGKFKLINDCLDACPSNKKYIQNSISRNCDPCNQNCLTCQNTTTTCLSCNVSALLFLQNKKCVSQCASNSFQNLLLGTCVPCQSPCNLCFNDSNVCSTCLQTSSKPIYYKFDCITASECPLGNFVNLQNNSCDTCPTQCTSCSSLTTCTSCSQNFALHQKRCIQNCPNTTYLSERVCLPCTGCLTCNGGPQECTSCLSSQFLYNGICYTDCPDGTFKNATTKTCQPCTSDCTTCRNTTFCLTCVADLYIHLGKCSVSCPLLTFPTQTNSVRFCQQCPTQCTECTSLTQCQKCKPGYNLQNDSACVITCSKGIAFNQVCYPCGLNCANCNQTSLQCQLCDSNYFLYEGKCLSKCPSTTLSLNGLSCVPCTVKFGQNCTTCSFEQCLTCSDGQLIGGQCVPCQQGTYPRSSKCAKCPSTCKSCFNETYCISCKTNYYMEQNFCTDVCPLNKIPNGTVCTQCLSYCAICNLENSLCSVCSSGFYLYESRCVNICPSPLVVNINSTKCVTQEQYYQDYSKEAKIVYFPFSISGGILFMIGIVIKCYSKLTHLVTLACAVISVAEIGGWAAFTYVQFSALINYHYAAQNSFILVIIAIAILIIIAIVQVVFYVKYLKADPLFSKWQKNHFCTDKAFLVLSVMFNFKLYRIVHSRLLERDQFSMKLNSLNKLLPFSLLSILSVAICSLPVMVGSGLALYFSISRDQQFFAALDCLTITSIMVILTLLDLRHQTTYFIVQIESQNLKRQIYEEDSLKFSVNGEALNENQKDVSKAQLINEVSGHLGVDSGTKFRGQSDMITTGYNQTQIKSQLKIKNKSEEKVEEINIDNQDPEFQQLEQEGDQAVPKAQGQNSEKHLLSQQEISQQEPKKQAPRWVQKKFDRHGYLLKTNQFGEIQRYDQSGNRVQIDDNGEHKKFDKDGNEVYQFMGTYCRKDQQGFILKDGKRYDKRGYQVRKNAQGENEFFNQEGFKVIQDQNGNVKFLDEYGHQIVKNDQGNIHRINSDGYEAFISENGEITYKDKDDNFVRVNDQGEYEIYDPEDGFKMVKNQNGEIQKYDKFGYRIEKDKWGNIYRYDNEGYRIVLGPNNEVFKYDKEGYQIRTGPNGQIKRYDKDGYEVRIDQNGKKKLYDENGYLVVKDYDGDITLYDAKGYMVIIDAETGEHRKFTQQGLRVVEQQDGSEKYFDKRGHQVVELPDGFYEKYDSDGNKIDLDLFGFQVEHNQNGEKIRYNKVGDIVDEQWFEQKLLQEQKMEQAGLEPTDKLKSFKPPEPIDFQIEYQKMLHEQNLYMEEESLQEEPHLVEFHHPEIYKEHNLEQMLTVLKDQEMGKELIDDNIVLDLNMLQEVDHNPQKQMKERQTKEIHVKKNGNFLQGKQIEKDNDQDYVELKSIADASINQRSFENEGVQPIDGDNSQYSQLQSLDQLSPNLALNSKTRKRAQRSEMSYNGENHDTKTQYNHKTVNVEIKKNNLYDQNQEIQSLNQENWIQQAQGQAGIFYNFTKDFSNANTNTHLNQIIYMDDVEDHDTLSSFVRQSSQLSQRHNKKKGNQRYDFDKNTIEEMQNQLFDKQFDEGIRQRRQFKLKNGPNPLVQYAKNLQSNKKSLQQKIYFQEVGKKKRRR